MTTIETNRLIAQFMGLTWIEKGDYDFPTGHYEKGEDWYGADFVNYNTSWDWLMPVVEKIENDTPIYINICENCCIIDTAEDLRNPKDEPLIRVDADTKLEATYRAILEFINWYKKASA